ncbi:MAG: Na/Pi cotransporter family protein [Kiritimatiellae bacterium]|nr:Na/Pi cotransporter family protein [Kiritimatiellia bacterium]
MENLNLTLTVLGGLAIFVYGMGLMSDGLKEIAGEKLKAALGYMTRNRFFAILAGAGVTALIQSSSATSVMTVGFVNAGLLSLQQAIGVIFGANIGTTITGQIVSFKLNDIALPAVTLGVVGLMIAKRVFSRGIWRTVLGFGLLFFGMTIMSSELKELAAAPGFRKFFELFDCTPAQGSGYMPILSILGAILVGTLCTMIVQSSSATIGITIALANSGVISVWSAIPIVLGNNIGTTITAAFAAIGANANARRTALAHAMFNILGTVIVTLSFFAVIEINGVAAPAFVHLVNAITEGNVFADENPGRHVAMAHTVFNVGNVIVLTAFIPLIAKFCTSMISGENGKTDSILEPRFLATPEIACVASVRALTDMLRRATTLTQVAVRSALGEAQIARDVLQEKEDAIDERQNAIRDYLVGISQHKINSRVASALPEILHCVNDTERISDLALILNTRATLLSGNITEEERSFINETLTGIRSLSSNIRKALNGDIEARKTALEKKCQLVDKLQSQATTTTNLHFVGVISSMRDVVRHMSNIIARVEAIS